MLSINADQGEASVEYTQEDETLLPPPLPPRVLNQSNMILNTVTRHNSDSEAEGDEEAGASEQPPDLEKLYENESQLWGKNAYLWMFPVSLEKRLQHFDDPLIKTCQLLRGKLWYYFSLLCTGVVAIEIGIAIPFILFILGYDGLAVEFTYLALVLALMSQIPKRFLWRFRPYMVGRAQMVKKDLTSSFPSRAVTCATVYSFAVIWGYVYKTMHDDNSPIPFTWWMPILFILAISIASFARVNLGVHYPSDCIAGLVQGLIICGIGTAFWKADTFGCQSCRDKKCYATDSDKEITFWTLDRMNFYMLILVFIICIIVPIVSIMKPIDFWSKCDRVYGLLFPGITFQLMFLCPHDRGGALPPPTPGVRWYSVIFACGLACLSTALCMKVKGKHPFLVYIVVYLGLLFSLVLWRLADM